jgi:mannose-1-phosphate guanylyltransferase / mannose-6-phosphate isomerase
MNIIPVILSGGSGTRLWPVSRQSKPKQFLKLGKGHMLIQEAALRCRADFFDDRLIVVAADAHRFLVAEALREFSIAAEIVLEPMPRDSCAAIVAGALVAQQRDPDAVIMVMASDHHIPDREAFMQAVQLAAVEAQAGHLVTFGIKPRNAATGYGYIQCGEKSGAHCFRVESFHEKPNRETAERYISDAYLWNSGNFVSRADVFLEEVRRFEPKILEAVEQSLDSAQKDRDFTMLNEHHFAASPKKSVDYAVMERTSKAVVMPVAYAWSDVGSWDAVADAMPADAAGNVVEGNGSVVQTKNTYVRSDGVLTAVVGCDDIVVVTTHDAVLVTKRGDTEKVKDLVGLLKASGMKEAE